LAYTETALRHIRFEMNADCSLKILQATVSPSGDDTFSNTIAELRNQGYTATERKYVIWTDANIYCGIALVAGNDSASSSFGANSGPNYARVDNGCWGARITCPSCTS
jgi:hypothetical protein